MTTLGLVEAWSNAVPIKVSADTTVRVASPAGLCLLKLIAFCDRPDRKHDAEDIGLVLSHFEGGFELSTNVSDDCS